MGESVMEHEPRPLPAPLPSARVAYIAAALVGASAGFLLCGYECVRSPANTLFKAAYGTAGLPYVMALVPVGVIIMIYGYGWLLTWLGPRRTLLTTTVASAVAMAAAYVAIRLGWRPASAILYILREAYIVLIIEQYWSFLNSTLGTKNAKQLNGPICGLGSMGAIVGALLVGRLATHVGTNGLLLLAAAVTLPAALLMEMAYRSCGEPRPTPHEKRSDVIGLRLLLRNRMLVILLGMIVLTQAVNTFLDLNFQGVLQDAIPNADVQTAYSGDFFAVLNVVAFAMQFVAAPIVLRLAPVAVVHVMIPMVHVGSCLYLLVSPSLRSAGLAFLLFKALDYSIFRAAKEILYIPLSFDARYRAKEVIDVFGYRASKGGTAGLVGGLRQMGMAVGEKWLATGALAAAALWLGLVSILPTSHPQK